MKIPTRTTTFIVIRHGETEWNKSNIIQGHLNSDLSKNGIDQAEAIANEMLERSIDQIVSSDLGRAMQTATIIADVIKKPLVMDIRLREQNFGIMQGITKGDFAVKYPNEWQKYCDNDPDYVIPNGESIQQKHTRCIACLEELSMLHLNKTILVVSHGGILTSFMYHAIGLALKSKRMFSRSNASINIFTINQDKIWRLESWGETQHLKKAVLQKVRLKPDIVI